MVTQEQIQEWKAKYGQVFKITVEDKQCYLRIPTRKDLSYASAAGKDNIFAFNESILNNCWLAGDEEIRTNDEYFLGASEALGGIIKAKKSKLVKL